MKKRFVKKNEFYYRKVSHPNNPTQKIIQKVRLNDPKFFFETVPDPKNPGKTKVLCFEIGIDCELESYSDPENPGQRKQQIKKLLNPKFQKYQKFTKINKETNTNTKKAKDFSIEKDKDQVDLNIQPPPLPLRLLPLCDAFAQTSPKPKHIFIKTTVDIPKRPETPKANPPHIRFENDGMIDTFHAVYTKIMPHTTCEIPPDPNFPPTRRGYKNNLSIPNNFSTPSSMRNITRTTIANVESRITKKPAMTFGATPGTISISKSPYSQNTMKTRNGIEFDSPDFDFDSFENQPSFLSFAGLTKFEHMNRVIKNMATHANEKSKQQPSRSQQNPHNVSPRRRTPKP
ncbi:hypothetical protein TRFO_20679 [Tritrichomonas foetus]|uniref:Uncharacterized protein n=1 Tax=Tritrichomonas foetus TaxID=1144522 RepID=A0A1J4KGR7_9EUKA|nr:hypothetical protein TRFO_20679 [Tritrichomonas foetus]|eukprot:OHT10136.1 hypothetical protein TRFO_20679 [Tritrichomonas foetus]